jgi:sugar (pentulose or hexulose) kinase
VIDANLAAMSGLYSLAMGRWWPAALRLCGLHEGQMPQLCPIGAVAGHTGAGAAAFGLPAGIPVVSAGNDQTAGAHAAKLSENHGLLITLGTAQTAYVCATKRPPSHPALIRGPFPQGGHYRMAADGYGGNLINWAGTVLAGCGTAEAFFRQAACAPPGCQGLRLELSEAPRQPSWRNIGFHHTPADFARSVLECLAQRVAGMLRDLGVEAARTKTLAAGGGSASPLWVQILSETLGAKVTVTQAQPFLGAARMASTAGRGVIVPPPEPV